MLAYEADISVRLERPFIDAFLDCLPVQVLPGVLHGAEHDYDTWVSCGEERCGWQIVFLLDEGGMAESLPHHS